MKNELNLWSKCLKFAFLLFSIFMLFVHRRVIKAVITGQPLPENPHNFCHRKEQ